jgi:restriction endonuclease Mrr
MSDSPFQYPPDLFALLVDAIPALCKAKKDVVLMFRGAGVPVSMTADIDEQIAQNRESVKKYEIARTILTRMNEGGDSLLAARRELLKRVTEFEDFSRCYENDVMKARGLVAEVRRVVNVKDSFTRMSQERDREAQARRTDHLERTQAIRQRQEKIDAAKNDLFGLYAINDPHRRGIALERTLSKLFGAYDILVAEDFRRKGSSGTVEEQIDGVIEIESHMYLVEMKWWAEPIGPPEMSQHMSRLFLRSEVGGIFISNSEFTQAALNMARDFLIQRVLVLCSLREVVDLMNRDGDLAVMLKAKIRAAKLDRNPYKEIA